MENPCAPKKVLPLVNRNKQEWQNALYHQDQCPNFQTCQKKTKASNWPETGPPSSTDRENESISLILVSYGSSRIFTVFTGSHPVQRSF